MYPQAYTAVRYSGRLNHSNKGMICFPWERGGGSERKDKREIKMREMEVGGRREEEEEDCR